EQMEQLSTDSRVVDMVDYLYNNFGVNYIEFFRYLSTTCNEEFGCALDKNAFTSYLERGRCMLALQKLPKFIVDPLIVKSAWIHYIEIVDNWLPFQPVNSDHYYFRKINKFGRRYLLLRDYFDTCMSLFRSDPLFFILLLFFLL
ncbi:hypothetical protein RFI_04040, partial [Reticulomyxa filosa]